MAFVLGIDAAWTETGSSGVALLECGAGKPRLVACAPSYSEFIALAAGKQVVWRQAVGQSLKAAEVLNAARRLGGDPNVVAIDMPISRSRILGRRTADQLISSKFGSAWAGTHSPNSVRPGEYGSQVTQAFVQLGFSLATNKELSGRSLIEVYPLAALVRLLNAAKRPPYKTSRSKKYWPDDDVPARVRKLLGVWSLITGFLRGEISELVIPTPDVREVATLSELKPYEDAMDAIISAYVGALYLKHAAEPYGDSEAAIWVPKSSQRIKERSRDCLDGLDRIFGEWSSWKTTWPSGICDD